MKTKLNKEKLITLLEKVESLEKSIKTADSTDSLANDVSWVTVACIRASMLCDVIDQTSGYPKSKKFREVIENVRTTYQPGVTHTYREIVSVLKPSLASLVKYSREEVAYRK